MSLKTVIIITGPTASGKTGLAVELAKHLNTSIISADSRQCFRELNIGVAKPSPEQLSSIPHFFINSHSIREEVNAAIFESLAMRWCEDIFSTHDSVILCGGTGLYIRAFRDGLDEIPVIDEEIRKEIISAYQEQGINWLRESVRLADPLFFSSGEISNPQRMMRALEVIKSTGRSIISFRNQQKKDRPFRILEFAIRLPRKELYRRIDERVDAMMDAGLLDEVKLLLPNQHLNALQTVGYSELFDYLHGKCSLEESIRLIKQNSRHYAKRQITWVNKSENLVWLDDDYQRKILESYSAVKT
jgi:tRNA dimethylallyltransferase